jgi:hypothetical protein
MNLVFGTMTKFIKVVRAEKIYLWQLLRLLTNNFDADVFTYFSDCFFKRLFVGEIPMKLPQC